jgi:hypothetical protein
MADDKSYSEMITMLQAEIAMLSDERERMASEMARLATETANIEAAVESLRRRHLSQQMSPLNGTANLPASAENPSLVLQPPQEKVSRRGQFSRRDKVLPPAPDKPDHGRVPLGAGEDWVSLLAKEASPYALGLAVLRAHEGTISSAELNYAIGAIRGIKGGVGYTILEPLQKAGIIEGNHDQWRIKDRTKGGIIVGKWLWSQQQNLNIYDKAAMRREAIYLLLVAQNRGLAISTMFRTLQKADWLKATVTPHLIKSDMRHLEKQGVVRQDYERKTWGLQHHDNEVSQFAP